MALEKGFEVKNSARWYVQHFLYRWMIMSFIPLWLVYIIVYMSADCSVELYIVFLSTWKFGYLDLSILNIKVSETKTLVMSQNAVGPTLYKISTE